MKNRQDYNRDIGESRGITQFAYRLRHVRKAGRKHTGHSGGVLNTLHRHPFLGPAVKLARWRVVFEFADSAPGDGCVMVLNWLEDLKQRAPVK